MSFHQFSSLCFYAASWVFPPNKYVLNCTTSRSQIRIVCSCPVIHRTSKTAKKVKPENQARKPDSPGPQIPKVAPMWRNFEPILKGGVFPYLFFSLQISITPESIERQNLYSSIFVFKHDFFRFNASNTRKPENTVWKHNTE
jgi:hypothetical protein